MKGVAKAILIVLLIWAFTQPLIEMSIALTDKVQLGAAMLNSCRSARANALTNSQMRDLNAAIDLESFSEYFAEAFCETLNLTENSLPGTAMVFTSLDGRWETITVRLDLYTFTDDYLGDREAIQAEISLTTQYIFRTPLLREMAAIFPAAYNITETRRFDVQMTN